MKQTFAMKRVTALGAVVMLLFLTGCGSGEGQEEVDRHQARAQLDAAVEAVQSATGTDWVVDAEPGLIGCSRTHSQWHTSWDAVPTAGRDESYDAAAKALEEAGFTTYIFGPRSSTPILSAQTGHGFGLGLSTPLEGGAIRFNVSSDCFLEEEE